MASFPRSFLARAPALFQTVTIIPNLPDDQDQSREIEGHDAQRHSDLAPALAGGAE